MGDCLMQLCRDFTAVCRTEVPERVSHSADVLLRIYAKCTDDPRDKINKTIGGLLDWWRSRAMIMSSR